MSKKYVEIEVQINGTSVKIGELFENKSFVEDETQYIDTVNKLLKIKKLLYKPAPKKPAAKKKPSGIKEE